MKSKAAYAWIAFDLALGCNAPVDPEYQIPNSQQASHALRSGGGSARVFISIRKHDGSPEPEGRIFAANCPVERQLLHVEDDLRTWISAAAPGRCTLAARRRDGPAIAWSDEVSLEVEPDGTYEVVLTLPNDRAYGPGFWVESTPERFLAIAGIATPSPAESEGLTKGTGILEVDGLKTQDARLADVERALYGPRGSSISLVVGPPSQPRTVHLVRDEFPMTLGPLPLEW